MAFKTSIDSNVCSGNKKCAIECPEVYEIIEGYGEVKKGMEIVPDNLLAKSAPPSPPAPRMPSNSKRPNP